MRTQNHQVLLSIEKANTHTWTMSRAYLERLMVVVCSDLMRVSARNKHVAELKFI